MENSFRKQLFQKSQGLLKGFSVKKEAGKCFASQVRLKQELQGLESRSASVVKVRVACV